jgi:hypothetical protein
MRSLRGCPAGNLGRMRILTWNTHGGWMNSFVRGKHDFLLPVDRDGRGGRSWHPWPANVRDIREALVAGAEVDLVVAHEPWQLEVIEGLTGRAPGTDMPAIYVEHNPPTSGLPGATHPLADHPHVPVVHVTHFNALMWDHGRGRTRVIEHGVVDPGYHYTGEVKASAVIMNEPMRLARRNGTDFFSELSKPLRIDVFGTGGDDLGEQLGLGMRRLMHAGPMRYPRLLREASRRRLYLHTARWTSLGVELLEAMASGMPVVGVSSTEIGRAVPREAGVLSANIGELAGAIARFGQNPDAATTAGLVAREYVLRYYSLREFHARWDELLEETVSRTARRRALLPRKQKTSAPVVTRLS